MAAIVITSSLLIATDFKALPIIAMIDFVDQFDWTLA